jgi:ribosomal protein S18 acetylase RimI-like enzyme
MATDRPGPTGGARPSGGAGARDDDVVVRPVRPDEYDRLAELTLAAYLEVEGVAGDDEYVDELRDVAGRAAQVPVLVAVDVRTGELLGGVAYIPGPGPLAEMEQADEAGFRMLAVSPATQGRGIGRLLVEACLDRARAARKRRVVLLTMPTMYAAHRLYERLGFARDPDHDWEYAPGHLLLAYALDLRPS